MHLLSLHGGLWRVGMLLLRTCCARTRCVKRERGYSRPRQARC